MSAVLDSRFITDTDPSITKLIFDLPETWWSRFYEYKWASSFAEVKDVCLDAASGICHPLKFYLSDICKEVYACDIDERITQPGYILKEISEVFGETIAKEFPLKYFQNVQYSRSSLTALPYEENKFDKIYCISVLEHLNPSDMLLSLAEFKRTLKDNGLIILTFDYPTVNIENLKNAIQLSGLEFAGNSNFDMPKDAIYSDLWGRLYCIRAVLKKVL